MRALMIFLIMSCCHLAAMAQGGGHTYTTGCRYSKGTAKPEVRPCPACVAEDKGKRAQEAAERKAAADQRKAEEERESKVNHDAAERVRQEHEEKSAVRRKTLQAGSSSTGSAAQKEAAQRSTTRQQELMRQQATLYNNALNMGDAAMQRGDYQGAMQHYNNAKKMSTNYDNSALDKKIQHAQMSALGQSAAPVLADVFEQATGGFAALQGSYSPQEDYGNVYSLGINYHGYWKYFCMEMTLGLRYAEKAGMWVQDTDYELEKHSAQQGSKIADDRIIFRDISRNGSQYTLSYKTYQQKETNIAMAISGGAGLNIPFRGLKPNFMFVGFYNPSLGSFPSFYGYKYLFKLDCWHNITLSLSYNTVYYNKDAFHQTYLINPYANRSLKDLDELIAANTDRKFHRLELGIGIKIINND